MKRKTSNKAAKELRGQPVTTLEQQNLLLTKLKTLALGLASLPSGQDIHQYIVRMLKETTDAYAAAFSIYDPVRRSLRTIKLDIDPGILEKVTRVLGKSLTDAEYDLPDDLYRQISSEKVAKRHTLTEVSFGAIPPSVGAAIQQLTGVDRFIGISYLVEGVLYGTSMLALKTGEAEPATEFLESFANMVAVSLRREQAQEALQNSERKYRELIQSSSDPIFSFNPDETYRFVNEAFAKPFGKRTNDIIGKTPHSLFSHDEAEKRLTLVRQVLKTGVRGEIDVKVVTLSGDVRHYLTTADPIQNEEGAVVYVSCTSKDITERKRSEELLRESEEKYRLLIENNHDIIYTLTADGVFTFVSPAWTTLLGHPTTDVVGHSFEQFVHADDLPACYTFLESVINTEGRQDGVEYRVQHIDGTWRWHTSSGVSKKDSGGEIEGFVGTASDITDRKRAEVALISAKETAETNELIKSDLLTKLNEAQRSAKTGSWDWDMITGKVWWSDELYRIFEVDPVRYIPNVETNAKYVHPEDNDPYHKEVNRVIQAREELNYDLRIIAANGELKYCHSQAKLECDGAGNSIRLFGTFSDITARKRAEEKLQQSEASLAQAQRIARIGSWEWYVETNDAHWSDETYRIFGLMPRKLDRHRESFLHLIHPDDRARVDQALGDAIQGVREYDLDYRITLADGTEKVINAQAEVVRSSDGKPVMMRGTVQDITERKRAEEELRATTERLHFATVSAKAGVWDWSLQTNEMIWDDRMYELYGLTRKNSPGGIQAWEQGLHRDDSARAIEEFQAALRGERDFDTEFRVQHPDGSVLYIKANGLVIRDENGKPLRMIGLNTDVTEHKRMEQQIADALNYSNTILEASPIGIITYKESGEAISANQAAAEITGATIEQLQAQNFRELNSWRQSGLLNAASEALVSGEERSIEMRGVSSFGKELWLSARFVPFIHQGNKELLSVFSDISARKQAEEELRFLGEIMTHMVEAVYLVRMVDGVIVYANPNFEQMFGYEPGEMEGKHLSIVNDPAAHDPRQRATDIMDTLNKTGFWQGEVQNIKKDGVPFWTYARVTVFHHSQYGRVLVSIQTDITERKRAEEDLRESEMRFRQLSDATLEGIAISEKGLLVDGNIQLTTMLGYGLGEIIGKPVLDFVAPDYRSLVLKNIREGLESPYENAILRKDGSLLRVETHARAMMWKGKMMRATVLLDISERTRAEAALRESEEFLNESQRIANMGSWELDLTNNNVHWSDNCYALYGLLLNEIEPSFEYFKNTVHPDDMNVVVKAFEDAVHFRKPNFTELRIILSDGTIKWIQNSMVPVLENDAVVKLKGIQIDITARKRAEEALLQSQKLESIGTLAGGIAHDFNNILNAVLGQSALALAKLPKESPAGGNITKAISAAERAADLTRQLLAYSGKGRFLTGEIDLNLLVNENINLLEVSVPKTTQLRLELDSSSPHILGDVGQIQQVIMNLIINAGEAMGPNPGTITVRTSCMTITQDDTEYWKYTAAPLAPGKYAVLQIRDNGCGMTEETLNRIFDPFYTTKFTGRGLGLAAVLGIIRGHNGGVCIKSEEGQGTQFDIVFPIVAASARETIMSRHATVIDGSGKAVLLIDDDAPVLELLAEIFSSANFTVHTSSNPTEGIELYRQHQEQISVVILDYSMPGMDGKAAFEELVKINSEVKVLLCSGYTEEETTAAFGTFLPADFLQKPYQPAKLLERVARILSE